MGTFGVNGEEVRGHTHGFSETGHGEESATNIRHDMGDIQDRSSVGSGRNSVGYDLHRDTIGNCGTVGGVAANIWSVCRREGLRGGTT